MNGVGEFFGTLLIVVLVFVLFIVLVEVFDPIYATNVRYP